MGREKKGTIMQIYIYVIKNPTIMYKYASINENKTLKKIRTVFIVSHRFWDAVCLFSFFSEVFKNLPQLHQ